MTMLPLFTSSTTTRAFLCKCRVPKPKSKPKPKTQFWNRTHESTIRHYHLALSNMGDAALTLQEWQGWGTTSPVPTMVAQIVHDLKVLEKDFDAHMSFGGNGGKLQVFLTSSKLLLLLF